MYLPLCLVLVTLASVNAFVCPSTGTFYHADVSTGCQVYHFCDNSIMQTLSCSKGQIFSGDACVDATSATCSETHHHLHKRSASTSKVHFIAIDELKQGARIFYETVKAAAIETIRDVAPSVYDMITDNYNVTIQKVKSDVMPIVKEKVVPRVMKALDYSRRMAGKVYGKLQRSFQMTNSTHIVVESFDDIVDEVAKDIKPLMSLGKYLSARLAGNGGRHKRSVEDDTVSVMSVIEGMMSDVPNGRVKRSTVTDMITSFMGPHMRSVASTVGGLLTGTDDSLTAKIIVPTLAEMLSDPQTRFDLKRVFWSSKATFAPLVDEMLKQEEFNTPQGTLIRIRSATFNAARDKFFRETKPILKRVFFRHLPSILQRSSRNVPLILSSLGRLASAGGSQLPLLTDSIVRFFQKHGPIIFSMNSGTDITSYTFSEIKKDLKPIEMTLLQVMLNYFTSNRDSLLGAAFNRQSPLIRAFVGEEVYAKPNSGFYSSQRALNARYQNYRG